jgi:signal transduction histidine kinase
MSRRARTWLCVAASRILKAFPAIGEMRFPWLRGLTRFLQNLALHTLRTPILAAITYINGLVFLFRTDRGFTVDLRLKCIGRQASERQRC